MKTIVSILAMIFVFSSCGEDKLKISNPKVNFGEFTLTASHNNGCQITVIIQNKKNEKFAFAKKSQTQGCNVMIEQLVFSETNSDTIKILINESLQIYELIKDEEGDIRLKRTKDITNLQSTFKMK